MSDTLLFTPDSFDKAVDMGTYFEVRLSTGKLRKLNKQVVGNDLTLEDYRRMILRGDWILIKIPKKPDQPQIPDENGVLQDYFQSFLRWKHTHGDEPPETARTWLEGGMSRFLTVKPIKDADPNGSGTVYETRYAWAFPSLGYGRINKSQFGKLISLAEAKEIARLAGPGLTLHGLVGSKQKPFSAILSWSLAENRIVFTYLENPALDAFAEANEGGVA